MNRTSSLLAAFALALVVAAPALAQNNEGGKLGRHNNQADNITSRDTGVGRRGNHLAPSTTPDAPGPNSIPGKATGVGHRGSKLAPSTEPTHH